MDPEGMAVLLQSTVRMVSPPTLYFLQGWCQERQVLVTPLAIIL